jgi:type II secretory ATPase GspE/PulE/Tfp pilus assembly ATPase PilB-like protein
MEVVYFVLGIVTVLLVLGVVIIVRVGTLVKELKEKVRESERHLDDETREIRLHIKDTLGIVSDIKDVLHRTLDDTARDIYQRVDEVENILDRRIDDEMRDVYSQLDSRLDKLENKIKSSKNL